VTAQKAGPGGPPAGHPGEVRLPAAFAVAVAIALYALLPSELIQGARFVVPAIEIVLVIPLIAANPYRMTRENRVLRLLALALSAVVAITNAIAFVTLLHRLIEDHPKNGGTLLLGALQIWLTNIIAFGLIFWELDRGGPVARSREKRSDLPPADFRFSQDEDDDAVDEVGRRGSKSSDWRARFVDYFYVSVTNSSAFSPTDTMPLSPRAKMLMSLEATEALLLSILVVASGVSLLK
jgi:hypothetical protein